jgi:hypothetical protein
MSAELLGAAWPFSVPYGTVYCVDNAVLFAGPDGTRYGINGFAQSLYPDLPPVEDIWLFDPDPAMANAGFRVDIGPIIDRGLELCD